MWKQVPAIDLYDTYKIIYYHKLLFLDRVTQTEKEKPQGYHELPVFSTARKF